MDYTMFLETLRLELTQKLGEGQTLMIRHRNTQTHTPI